MPGVVAAVFAAAIAGCGPTTSSSPAPPPTTSGFTITISNLSFSPLNLHVPPGGTVTVVNQDSVVHSVTSEASPNAFTNGSVSGIAFDTGLFTGTRTFTIPANAPTGAVVPYFCMNHRGMMNTPNGSITIDPTATATTSSGGGGMPSPSPSPY
jgi:plastocyanin